MKRCKEALRMTANRFGRRELLRAGAGFLFTGVAASAKPGSGGANVLAAPSTSTPSERADVTVRIGIGLIEIAPQRILSTVTYNGKFPGPLLRLREGKRITVDIYNDTDTPEQLHWHGQLVPTGVDGAAEERTPYVPAHGMRRISFVPRPSGFRFYHTHVRGGGNLHRGQYTGQVGPVYIEPATEAGAYDREVFIVLKEFGPFFSLGGDVAQDFLAPATRAKDLEEKGESAMRASLARGMPHGYEVGYRLFTINGKMLGHGEPVRVRQGERVLFHVLNGSATEIRSLALPGHQFRVVALDGNPVPKPTNVPALWLGTAERVSAIVEMNHPGVWVMGDLGDDDRNRGMGIVVEYAGRTRKPQWVAPPATRWDYTLFGSDRQTQLKPDETFEMTFAKENAADHGFNRWTINGVAFDRKTMPVMFHLKQGKRYRLRMRNASDDIHPVHLHRHIFEVTQYAGKQTSGVKKDVIMVGGYQEAEVDFTADDPGLTLFHCHQLLHMDFGFMALFDYA
jgi:FtsP/CotA-like multicopper oxidase with cupredoxin domain